MITEKKFHRKGIENDEEGKKMIIRSSYMHTPKEASITTPVTTPTAAPLEISEDDEITQYIHPLETSDDEEEPLQSTSTLQYMHPTQPISEIQHIINKVAQLEHKLNH